MATADADQRLIEAMLEPPPLEQARGSLEFWRQRRAALPFYRRAARREADTMIRRCHERVQAAERRRYGTGPLGLLRRLLAGDPPSWSAPGTVLWSIACAVAPRRLLVVGGLGAVACMLASVLAVLALIVLLV
jgi:hypothetical protein